MQLTMILPNYEMTLCLMLFIHLSLKWLLRRHEQRISHVKK